VFHNVGPLELVIVLLIVLVIFGPKRLPGLGRSLGTGLREFKDSISGKDKDSEHEETLVEAHAAPSAPAKESEREQTGATPQHGA
jgi:sec-independent protein translocase protein TatA